MLLPLIFEEGDSRPRDNRPLRLGHEGYSGRIIRANEPPPYQFPTPFMVFTSFPGELFTLETICTF
jgi:hypothetical protein